MRSPVPCLTPPRGTLLLRVGPEGPACHTGARTIASRRGADPEESYTARLLAAGPERIGRKLGEEAMETVLAAVVPPSDADRSGVGEDSLAWEAADLLYHLLVLLESKDVDVADVAAESARRHRAEEGR